MVLHINGYCIDVEDVEQWGIEESNNGTFKFRIDTKHIDNIILLSGYDYWQISMFEEAFNQVVNSHRNIKIQLQQLKESFKSQNQEIPYECIEKDNGRFKDDI